MDLWKIKIITVKNKLLLIPLLFIFACANKEQAIFDQDVQGIVHQCNNIWKDFKTAENTHALAASNFLEAQEIEFIDLEVTNTGQFILCNFCFPCPSDKIVHFKVRKEDLETILALGFEEN